MTLKVNRQIVAGGDIGQIVAVSLLP